MPPHPAITHYLHPAGNEEGSSSIQPLQRGYVAVDQMRAQDAAGFAALEKERHYLRLSTEYMSPEASIFKVLGYPLYVRNPRKIEASKKLFYGTL